MKYSEIIADNLEDYAPVRSSKRRAVISIPVSRGQQRHVVVSWGHKAIEPEFAQESSNVIETHEHAGEFSEMVA